MSSTTSPVREIAAAIVGLINSRPHSPRLEEIEAAIDGAFRKSIADERIGAGTVSGGGPGEPITSIEFGPVLGSAGKPVEFGFENREFADLFCPYIRVAFATLGRDRAGVEAFVRGLVKDDPDARLVFQLLKALETIDGKFGAIAGVAQSAWARVIAVAEVLEAEDSDVGRALNRGAAKYLDKPERANAAPGMDSLAPADANAVQKALSGRKPAAAMSPAHAAHHAEWRGLIEDHLREFGTDCELGMTHAEVEAMEERMAAHAETIDALARRIHAVPARTWADVLLFAEVLFWTQWMGTDPEASDAKATMEGGLVSEGGICDEALIKLLEAIFTVAGVGHFAKENAQ